MSAIIRSMHPDDIEEVESLYQEYMEIGASRRKILLESLERKDSEVLVAEVGGSVAGVAHQVFYTDPLHAGKCSNILFLYVAKPFRRQGIGESLLRRMLDNAADNGVLEVHVSTRAGNVAAVSLYEKNGFEHAGPLFECTPDAQTDASSGTASTCDSTAT